ncbi:MAG: YciI family protein [Gemmataceae bacterium]|nr:YciI family protein [Gemmataceae bacterium]
MAQFMLILFENPGDFASMAPEQIQQVIEKYSAWGAKLGMEGKIAGGHKLTEDGGRKLDRKGSVITVTDGPYTESKEVIGGIYIVKAKDYAEACELAKTCPHMEYGRIEIRQIDFMGQPES